ncbi:MAG TPA: hypothetical protein VHD56_06690 [Tepidisphaeraceae bacterium]|nr:hypothetical protein [Tepidisphaeraceae bacterium]
MLLPEFEDLPFEERPDLTPYLVHLTKNTKATDKFSALDNLINILQTGKIWGSSSSKGFIKGPHKATCFMDVPFIALKYILNKSNSDPAKPRYEPYGIFITKKTAYKSGCRPVLYLSDAEMTRLRIPRDELWRVVRFKASASGWIIWIHEREWRCRGEYAVPTAPYGVLVRNLSDVEKLQKRIAAEPKEFKVKPRSIIPLSVICQGLPKF